MQQHSCCRLFDSEPRPTPGGDFPESSENCLRICFSRQCMVNTCIGAFLHWSTSFTSSNGFQRLVHTLTTNHEPLCIESLATVRELVCVSIGMVNSYGGAFGDTLALPTTFTSHVRFAALVPIVTENHEPLRIETLGTVQQHICSSVQMARSPVAAKYGCDARFHHLYLLLWVSNTSCLFATDPSIAACRGLEDSLGKGPRVPLITRIA